MEWRWIRLNKIKWRYIYLIALTESEFQNLRFQFGTLNRKVNNGDVTRKYFAQISNFLVTLALRFFYKQSYLSL